MNPGAERPGGSRRVRALIILAATGVGGAAILIAVCRGGQASWWIRLLAVEAGLLCGAVLLGLLATPETRRGKWMKLAAGLLTATALSCGLLLAAEYAFYRLDQRRLAGQSRQGTHLEGHAYDFSWRLGYAPKPNSVATGTLRVDGQVIYDCHYTTDEFGRRVVPANAEEPPEQRREFLLLFGCSFVFGEGVKDGESLPNYVAALSKGYTVYNYGCSGYGPAQMLAQLERDDFEAEIVEPSGALVYVYFPGHIRRAIGSMSITTQWGRHFPCYELDDAGSLVRLGTFKTARPWLTEVYGLLSQEQVSRYFQVDWPLRLKPRHLELTARILAEAARHYRERFGNDRFFVLVYPDLAINEIEPRAILPYLDGAGVQILDYSKTLDFSRAGYLFPVDRHPAAKANRALAERVVLDLDRAIRH